MALANKQIDLLDGLPEVRGKYRRDVALKDSTWFQVGGLVDVQFKPADKQDLACFLKHKPKELRVIALGVGSNVIIRDGGLDGVLIKLGRSFAGIDVQGNDMLVGAAALDVNVAQVAADHGLTGAEFLSGIPGCIGGAIAMNAGAYGVELKDILIDIEAVSADGDIRSFTLDECQFSYRHCGLPEGYIYTQARLRLEKGDQQAIVDRMAEIKQARESTQPVRSRTGGSTFANPAGYKAWELIDAAGCRGMMRGAAQVSEKHCNFLINIGDATAADLEALGEEVRARVLAHSGVELQWEIKRLGKNDS
ncbi:MAG: UDP-N-acetylmuramate dehydrogenase [Rickettsiales bacterium]|nr:UDP-N-acetylmuramate dehydrogenase [Rickettsiales bacterium]